MATIWKWQLTGAVTKLDMPEDAEILCCQMQRGVPCIWAIVDPTAEKIQRTFRIIGTGHDLPEVTLMYVGTVQELNGTFIWHIFEEVDST